MRGSLLAASAALSVLTLAACETTPSEPFRTIATEAEFNTLVVDRWLVNQAGEIINKSDGTFDGDFNGAKPVGTWRWEDGKFCRELVIGDNDFPFQCQIVETNGERLTFNRPDGTSSTWRYK